MKKQMMVGLFGLLASLSAGANPNPASFTFDGVLLDDGSNQPITGTHGITFLIYNPSESCLLYEESHASVVIDSTGAFTLNVGTGTRSGNDPGVAWATVFSNKTGSQVVGSSGTCAGGYTPASGDGRKLVVKVDSTVLTSYSISATPFATVAETLQGYTPLDFISTSGGSLAGFLRLDSQNEVRFADSGNTNYVALKAPGSVTTTYSLALPVADGSNGQMLITNGSGQLSWASPGGGGLPLAGGTMTGAIVMGGNSITATGNIAMNAQTTLNLGTYSTAQETTLVGGLTGADKGKTWFNSTSNTMMFWDGTAAQAVSAGGSAITALTGDVAATGPGSAAATIAASAVTAAKIASDAITTAKIKSTGGGVNRLLITDNSTGSSVTFADSCANGEILKWVTATGWTCSAQLPSSAIVEGGNSLGTGMTVGTNDNNSLVLETNNINRMTIAAGGNIGIGSAAPSVALDVVGDISATGVIYTPGIIQSGQLHPDSGIAGSPGLNFGGLNTGVFEASGAIGFTSVGVEKMRLTAAGNLGIGTATTTAKLEVYNADAKINGLAVGRGASNLAFNSALGAAALAAATTGNYNTAMGYWALKSATTGANNTALGSQALYQSTTGTYNTAVGQNALSAATVSNYNTALGYSAGSSVTVGTNNIFLGPLSGASVTTGSNNVIIGGAAGSAAMSDTIILSDGLGIERMRIDSTGKVGIGTTTPNTSLDLGMTTDAILLPRGTNVQRPAGPAGMIRYNTATPDMEMYDGTTWRSMSPVSMTTFTGGYSDSAVSTSTTYYTYPNGHSQINGGTPSTTDYVARTRNIVAHGGKLKNLYIKMTQDPASTWVFSVLINGSPSGMTCSVNSSFTTCNDTTNFPVVNPGDEIGMKIDTGTSGAAARAIWAFDLVSP